MHLFPRVDDPAIRWRWANPKQYYLYGATTAYHGARYPGFPAMPSRARTSLEAGWLEEHAYCRQAERLYYTTLPWCGPWPELGVPNGPSEEYILERFAEGDFVGPRYASRGSMYQSLLG